MFLYCGNCANPLRAGAKFCSKCPTPAGKGTNYCFKCSNKRIPGANFCGKCRFSFQVPKNPPIDTTTISKCRNCGNDLKGNNICSICGFVNPTQLKPPQPPIEGGQSVNPPRPPKPGQCLCGFQNGAGKRFCVKCHQQIPIPLPPIAPPPLTKPGECAACHTQNDPGVKICKKCRKPIPHPLPPIKQVPSKKQAGVYSAKVMERRRVTIPKQVCEALILEEGNYVTFSLEMNTVTFAKSRSQKGKKQA